MVSEKKRASNDRYDSKTYKRVYVNFRVSDDTEIMDEFENARLDGKPYRELIWEWYNAYKGTHE